MDSASKINQSAVLKIIGQIKTMLGYIVENGKTLPDWILSSFALIESKQTISDDVLSSDKNISSFSSDELNGISKIYSALAAAVLPATPQSIDYTTPSKKLFFLWGTKCIPIIRNMWAMSTLFLAGFIISGFNQNDNYYVQLNLLFSAGLGAYFYSLYTANKYVVTRTFDPTYVTFYYNRIIIGIIAGIILANLIIPPETNGSFNINTSIIALLGGFSSDAVLKILNRLVAMLVTLVRGDSKEILETQAAELKAKFLEKQTKLKLETASSLLPLLNDIKTKTDDESYKKIKTLIDKIFEEDGAGVLLVKIESEK